MPNPSNPHLERYQIFLVSLWKETWTTKDSTTAWRIRLENPRTGEWIGFTDISKLADFLEKWMARTPEEELPME